MPHFSISRRCPRISALPFLAACLAGTCATAFSAEVRLAWDAKTESDLAGYNLYYGIASESDVRIIGVGNVTTHTVAGLEPGTYWFCVTAYYTSGDETTCSNVVFATVVPQMYGFRDERGSSLVVALPGDINNMETFLRALSSLPAEALPTHRAPVQTSSESETAPLPCWVDLKPPHPVPLREARTAAAAPRKVTL